MNGKRIKGRDLELQSEVMALSMYSLFGPYFKEKVYSLKTFKIIAEWENQRRISRTIEEIQNKSLHY